MDQRLLIAIHKEGALSSQAYNTNEVHESSTEYQDGPKIIDSYSQRRGIEFTSLQY